MSFVSSIRTRYLAWSHATPLPNLSDAMWPVFQQWHVFDKSTSRWATVVHSAPSSAEGPEKTPREISSTPNLRLLTWNIDAFGDRQESRLEGILFKLQQMLADGNGPNVIFFQEVSRKALAYLLQHAWIRENWILSEADETSWADVPFATMTLLSRSQFGDIISEPELASSRSTADSTYNEPYYSLGPVWRIKYPSRFNRDALCCDILWNRTVRIRLVNIHLDSLPIQPNLRPRQIAIAASLVRTAGLDYGAIAGDWNPVTEDDKSLVQQNELVDAWDYLHPGGGYDGFTWGLDGRAPFPPGRLDKIAVLGLKPVDIQIIHPGELAPVVDSGEESTVGNGREAVPWSDHSGLVCSLSVSGSRIQ